jgi:hypothetical protein
MMTGKISVKTHTDLPVIEGGRQKNRVATGLAKY